jgi:hypothetical protein
MIHTCAKNGQTKRNVDRFTKMKRLERNQALIVVHTHHRIKRSFAREPSKQRVRRERTFNHSLTRKLLL